MKITASFVPRMHRLAMPIAVVNWALALITVAATFWLVSDALARKAERPVLEERLTQLERRIAELSTEVKGPSVSELAAMRQRVMAINTLSGVRGWPATTLLATLERLLPERASLVSLHHRLREGEVQLIAEAVTAETLTQFLMNLEKEPHFAEVLLAKQSHHAGSGSRTVQFELRLKEKP